MYIDPTAPAVVSSLLSDAPGTSPHAMMRTTTTTAAAMMIDKKKNKAKVVPPCSHAEFESLPEPLRRKYFSSLERLRIAEHHEHHVLHQQGDRKLPSRRAILSLGSSRRRRTQAESLKHNHYVAQADADFFLSLPPKVQRSAFSREEQTILVRRCDLSHSHSHSQHPSPSSSPCPSTTAGSPLPPSRRAPPHRQPCHRDFEREQRFSDFHFGFTNHSDNPTHRDYVSDSASDSDLNPAAPHRGRSHRRRSRSLASDDVSPTRSSPYGPVQQDLDLGTESTLLHLDTMSRVTSHPSRASFRRTLSLTHIPLRSSTSSTPLAGPEPLSARATAPWHQRSHSQSASGRRSSHTPQAPVFDPEATHYRDAETRKKLQFLASPQKFDEAVEFGFPSVSGDSTVPHRYQLPPISTDARNFSRDMQTFLKDDRISFLDDNDDDENNGLESDAESVADFESPVTPSSVGLSFRCHRKQSSNFSSSMDSNGAPLIHPVTGRLNREMTLRMTLTRPDLRADEEQLYGWQGQKNTKDDPFALEDLMLTDDMNGTKGPFYVKPKPHGSLVSRLLKRSSKKGR